MSKRPECKGWAAKEVICHLRDAEESSMARFDVIMAINDPKLVGVNPDRRAEDDFLSLIAWHDDDHVDQLNRALDGRA